MVNPSHLGILIMLIQVLFFQLLLQILFFNFYQKKFRTPTICTLFGVDILMGVLKEIVGHTKKDRNGGDQNPLVVIVHH